MRAPVDDVFLSELARLRLRFTCDACLHLLPDGRCGNEWPNDDHLRPPATPGGEVVFCKEFEVR